MSSTFFGGLGADTLTGTAGDNYLVGGNDADVDVLSGGDGNDSLIGRYNQNSINASDRFFGGAGDDHMCIVDPARELAGGLPDAEADLTGTSTGLMHDGAGVAGGAVDGGAGQDILDFRQVNGPISLRIASDTMTSIERIEGINFSDTFFFADNLAAGVMSVNQDADALDAISDAADFSRVTDPGGLSFRFLNAVIDGDASVQVSALGAPETAPR